MENSGNPISSGGTDPKTVGIVSYLTLIGWIVALVLNNPKSEHGSFHVRQMLGLILCGVALNVIAWIPFLGQLAALAGVLLLIILWIMGFIGALNGEQKPVPILGDKFQEWFKSL